MIAADLDEDALEVTCSEDARAVMVKAGIDEAWLKDRVRQVWPLAVKYAKDWTVLEGICEQWRICGAALEVNLISDEEISRVHADFLDDPSATDVITFEHGELLISVDTAERQAAENGLTVAEEVWLYAIHGLLHLGGWDDHEPLEAAEMAALQQQLLAEVKG
jgi:rRNA maturation RNase YbeY